MDKKRLKEEAEKFFHASRFTDKIIAPLIDDFELVERTVDGEQLIFRTDVIWEEKSRGIARVIVSAQDNTLMGNLAPPAYGEPYQLSPESMAEIARKQAEKRSHRRWRLPFSRTK